MKKPSPAMQLLETVWVNNGYRMGRSWTRVDCAMNAAMRLAIEYGLEFAVDDFATSEREFGIGGEVFYTLACHPPRRHSSSHGRYGPNPSACRSFERWKKRKPFIIDGSQRLAVGAVFEFYGEQVECTSFSENGEHIVACSHKPEPDGRIGSSSKVLHRIRITIADLHDQRAAGRKLKQIHERVAKLDKRTAKALGHWKGIQPEVASEKQLRLSQLIEIERKLDELAA